MHHKAHEKHLIALSKRTDILRSGDLERHHIPRIMLTRLLRKNMLEKIARGLYRLPDAFISENDSMVTIALKTPKAIFCLLTALQFHEITTQMPRQVWLAMPRGSHTPKIKYPPVKMIQFSDRAYSHGIDIIKQGKNSFKIYSVAKTIADCFKHRNKIGLDIALEALKDALKKRKVTRDELFYYAKINRVAKIMRPYLEAIE